MAELVALQLPGGPGFVDALARAWDAGEAVLPVDHRLPAPAVEALLDAMAPTAVIDEGGRRPHRGRLIAEGTALVVATSGTTGDPKGVLLSHDAVRASAQATSARIGVDPDRDRWLACLPLAHVGGLSVVTRALVTGTPVDAVPGFDARAVDDSAATLVALVPTTLPRIDPTRWRAIVLGGSSPPSGLPDNVHTTYGLTETGSGVVYDGRPLDGVEVRVDGDGQINLRGPMLARTYRNGDAVVDADGWLATGDLGRWDGERLTVLGRADDLIKTGGEKVWPVDVERVLAAHPAVSDVVVAGRPDPEWGQAVVAFVVAEPGTPPTLAELRAAVKERLPAWCAPKELVLVSAIPRTALGKPRRSALTLGTEPEA